MRLGLLNDVGLVVVFVSLTIIIHSIIPIFIGLGSLNIVIVSPKAITNVADAEAWFRAVPSGENVMKFAHDWGSVLSICEGHQPYTLCTCSIIPARCQPEYIRNCFFTFSSLWRISSCGATEVAQGSIQLERSTGKKHRSCLRYGVFNCSYFFRWLQSFLLLSNTVRKEDALYIKWWTCLRALLALSVVFYS